MSDMQVDRAASDSDEYLPQARRKRTKRDHNNYFAQSEDEAVSDVAASPQNRSKRTRKKDPGSRRRNPSRQVPAKVADGLPIPHSISEFSEPDRVMWDMKKSGQGWEEIRKEWERLTGQKTAPTTLPNRFVRIRDKIGDFSSHDDDLLLRCKRELDDIFAKEIWAMVAEAMIAKGGNKFSVAAIKKRYEQLNQVLPEAATGGVNECDDEA